MTLLRKFLTICDRSVRAFRLLFPANGYKRCVYVVRFKRLWPMESFCEEEEEGGSRRSGRRYQNGGRGSPRRAQLEAAHKKLPAQLKLCRVQESFPFSSHVAAFFAPDTKTETKNSQWSLLSEAKLRLLGYKVGVRVCSGCLTKKFASDSLQPRWQHANPSGPPRRHCKN